MKNLFTKSIGKRSLCTVLISVVLLTAVASEIRSFAVKDVNFIGSEGERIVLWSSIFGGFDGGSVMDSTTENSKIHTDEDTRGLKNSNGRTIIKFRIVEIFTH